MPLAWNCVTNNWRYNTCSNTGVHTGIAQSHLLCCAIDPTNLFYQVQILLLEWSNILVKHLLHRARLLETHPEPAAERCTGIEWCAPSSACCSPLFSAVPLSSWSVLQGELRNLLFLFCLQLCLQAVCKLGERPQSLCTCWHTAAHAVTTLPVSSSCNFRCRSATVPVMFCAFFSSFWTDFEPVRRGRSFVLPSLSVTDCMLPALPTAGSLCQV